MWIIQPRKELWKRAEEVMAEGAPIYDEKGEAKKYQNGTLLRQLFHMSDIAIARGV